MKKCLAFFVVCLSLFVLSGCFLQPLSRPARMTFVEWRCENNIGTYFRVLNVRGEGEGSIIIDDIELRANFKIWSARSMITAFVIYDGGYDWESADTWEYDIFFRATYENGKIISFGEISLRGIVREFPIMSFIPTAI
jgi:hypothetical protein